MNGFDEYIPPNNKYDTQKIINKDIEPRRVGIPGKVGSKKDAGYPSKKMKAPPTTAMEWSNFIYPQ